VEEAASTQQPSARSPLRGAGWLLLAIVTATVVVVQLAEYFGAPSEEKGSAELTVAASQARLNLWLADTAERGSPGSGKQLLQSFKATWKGYERSASASPEAAKTWSPVAHELGMEVPEDVLKALRGSGSKADAAFASLYSGGKPEPSELGGTGFSAELARLHAEDARGGRTDRGALFPAGLMLLTIGVMGAFALALLAGTLLLLAFAVQAKKMRQAGFPESPQTPADADRKALRMGLYMILYFSLVATLVRLLPLPASVMVKAAAAMSLFVPVLLALLKVPVSGVSDGAATLLGRRAPLGKLVLAGAWAWLAALPVVLLSAAVLSRLFPGLPQPTHPTTVEMAGGQGAAEALATYLLAAVLAPFLEELTFRGLLFPALKRHMPWVAAAAVSGLTFAAIHPQGPLLWVSLGTLGVAGAVSAQYTGSLVPAMVMHALNNASVLTLSLVLFQ
jgi:hypothetical protein